jgi:ribosomal-protein-alanine N-acetyltransferase
MPYILENMMAEDIPDVAAIERLCFRMPWPTSAYRRELKTPETNRYIVARFVPPDIARQANLPVPDVDNITRLHHPEVERYLQEHLQADAMGNLGQHRRSVLYSLLPWLRNGTSGGERLTKQSILPVVGYAGLWLMVDEAHVTTIGVHPAHRGQGVGELLFVGLADIAQQMKARRITLEVRVSNTTAQALYRKYGLEVAGVRKRYYSDNGEDAYIMWSDPIDSPAFKSRIEKHREELAKRLQRSFYQQLPPSRPVDAASLQ